MPQTKQFEGRAKQAVQFVQQVIEENKVLERQLERQQVLIARMCEALGESVSLINKMGQAVSRAEFSDFPRAIKMTGKVAKQSRRQKTNGAVTATDLHEILAQMEQPATAKEIAETLYTQKGIEVGGRAIRWRAKELSDVKVDVPAKGNMLYALAK